MRVSRPLMKLSTYWGSGKGGPLTRLPALQRREPGGIRFPQKTSGLFNVNENVFSFDLSEGTLPSVTMSSQNLTPSPLADLGEFVFPAPEDSAEMLDDDIFGDLMLPVTPPEVTQRCRDSVEFGEMFTDINSLLTLACSSVAYDEDTTTHDASELASVVMPTVALDDGSLTSDACVFTISVPLNGEQQYTTIDTESFLLDEESFETKQERSHLVTHEPDHSYSTVKQTTRKRNHSEISEDHIDKKSPKYLERRRKNNIASKRSREMRKNKFLTMDEQADELEKANQELREKIEKLESLTKKMKEALVAKLSAAK